MDAFFDGATTIIVCPWWVMMSFAMASTVVFPAPAAPSTRTSGPVPAIARTAATCPSSNTGSCRPRWQPDQRGRDDPRRRRLVVDGGADGEPAVQVAFQVDHRLGGEVPDVLGDRPVHHRQAVGLGAGGDVLGQLLEHRRVRR